MREDIRVSARAGGGACAYCKDAIPTEQRRQCTGCAATYHAECHGELQGCATIGCAERALRPGRAAQVEGSRTCADCRQRFTIRAGSPHAPTCAACTTARNARTVAWLVLGAAVYIMIGLLFSTVVQRYSGPHDTRLGEVRRHR